MSQEAETLIFWTEPLKNKLLKNSFWLYFFAFLVAPAWYILKLIIARQLTLEEIGLFYSVLWLVTIISAYNDLGLTDAIQYFIPKYIIQHRYAKAVTLVWITCWMQLITAAFFWGMLYFFSGRLAEHYFHSSLAAPVLQVFSLYFLIINLYQVAVSLFFATQKVKRAQGVDTARMWSIVAFTAVMAYAVDVLSLLLYTYIRLWGVIVWLLVAFIGTRNLFPWIFVKPSEWLKKNREIKKRLSYGWRVMIWQSAGTLYGQVNQQLVLFFLGSANAAIRAYYLVFFSIISIVSVPLSSYLFPLLNELYEKQENNKIQVLYKYLLYAVIAFGIVGGITAYYLSPRISEFLFGAAFRQAWELFQLFSPWIFMMPCISIIFSDIASRGMVRERVYVLLIGLVVNTVASYFFIRAYGLVWSVYGHIAGTVSLLLVSLWFYRAQWLHIFQRYVLHHKNVK